MYSLIGLLIQTKEIERFAELVGCSNDGDLQQVSHYALEPAARSLEKTHAGDAARLWCAMDMRIVSAGKSKYYTAGFEKITGGTEPEPGHALLFLEGAKVRWVPPLSQES